MAEQNHKQQEEVRLTRAALEEERRRSQQFEAAYSERLTREREQARDRESHLIGALDARRSAHSSTSSAPCSEASSALKRQLADSEAQRAHLVQSLAESDQECLRRLSHIHVLEAQVKSGAAMPVGCRSATTSCYFIGSGNYRTAQQTLP